ncbi:rho GTPase-activating protein 5-like [Andrographis paniculata]|uniref:rho GTPase-activating protein 5-like n=1 Tax=Andrographis paniculata TaxID=175694 RepID=UPI0021E7E493|nr:rho GTPase-activating protein 5-like [Andrographis paniculata]
MTTDILHSPPRLHPSPPSPIDDALRQQTFINGAPVSLYRRRSGQLGAEEEDEGDHLSVLAALVTVFRKSLVGCRDSSGGRCGVEDQFMEIGWPTDVRHVAHVTFDRFDGFLGLPVEFEPEVPRRPPSASTTVFGVSTESMQLSFDSRGNCVPTILLMMQRRLYSQGGLQMEGIFRINPGNGQEEYVREQLNNGLIPENIDVHCLAGLIKAWFRELPRGVLDSLPRDQVMEAQSEEECIRLVRLLPPTEAALLDWAINLMVDVVQFEPLNKMNARNIAMVFAPNMTQMSDPLTALMFAVQVMNFLKALIVKTLREREDRVVEAGPAIQSEPSDEDSGHSVSKAAASPELSETSEEDVRGKNRTAAATNLHIRSSDGTDGLSNSTENALPDDNGGNSTRRVQRSTARSRRTMKPRQPASCLNDVKKGLRKHGGAADAAADKKKELNIVSRVNTRAERVETWR